LDKLLRSQIWWSGGVSTLRAVIWSLEMHVTRLLTLFFCHCGRKAYKSFCVGCAIDETRDYLLLGLAKFSGSFQCKCEEIWHSSGRPEFLLPSRVPLSSTSALGRSTALWTRLSTLPCNCHPFGFESFVGCVNENGFAILLWAVTVPHIWGGYC
jgi:hypothetical protein